MLLIGSFEVVVLKPVPAVENANPNEQRFTLTEQSFDAAVGKFALTQDGTALKIDKYFDKNIDVAEDV